MRFTFISLFLFSALTHAAEVRIQVKFADNAKDRPAARALSDLLISESKDLFFADKSFDKIYVGSQPDTWFSTFTELVWEKNSAGTLYINSDWSREQVEKTLISQLTFWELLQIKKISKELRDTRGLVVSCQLPTDIKYCADVIEQLLIKTQPLSSEASKADRRVYLFIYTDIRNVFGDVWVEEQSNQTDIHTGPFTDPVLVVEEFLKRR